MKVQTSDGRSWSFSNCKTMRKYMGWDLEEFAQALAIRSDGNDLLITKCHCLNIL